ncbi:MAG: LpxI family protein, partial [Variibacter sp.]
MPSREDTGSVSPSPSLAEPNADTTLTVICGSGPLPAAIADAAIRRGRSVFLIAIEGWADAGAVARYPHAWIKLGQFGRAWRLARAAGSRDIVCIGGLVRPAIGSLRLDWETIRLLPRLYRLFRGGDDHLLSGLGRIFAERGFRMVAAQDVAPDILAPAGVLTRREPTQREADDIAFGFALLDAMGPFDVGQALVVAARRVLAVEAAEG